MSYSYELREHAHNLYFSDKPPRLANKKPCYNNIQEQNSKQWIDNLYLYKN
ncbi:hypothetical protein LguiA_025344 [Lonicera macranthoides]